MNAEILISDPLGKSISMPVVEEGFEWRLERAGVPGILEFKVVNDGLIAIDEGFAVQLHVDGVSLCFRLCVQAAKDEGTDYHGYGL